MVNMIRYFWRLLLKLNLIAPVCFTISFIGFLNKNYYLLYGSLIAGIGICLISIVIFSLANNKLQILNKQIISVKPVNKESNNYFLTCVLTLLGSEMIFQNTSMTVFFFICLIVYALFDQSYNFSLLLSLLCYHVYEAQDTSGVSFILLSKVKLRSIDPQKIMNVKQLYDYVYIYYDRSENDEIN